MVRIARWLVLALLATLAGAPLTALAQTHTEEYWYVVEMQGQRCGHMHAQTVHDGSRFVSTSEMRLEIKRGRLKVPITIATEFVETEAGKPVRMRSEMKLGVLPTIDEYVFKADEVEVTHTVAGSRRMEHKPLPGGEWLTPMAMERDIASKIAGGVNVGGEIRVRSVEPSAGLSPGTTTMKLVERTTLGVIGKTVPAMKWASKNDLVPNLTSTEFTDERGLPLRTETDMGGIRITLIRADKALALSKAEPPELLESTYIKPDKQVKNARESRTGVFVVRAEGVPIGTWSGAGAQTVTPIDVNTVRIHVDAGARSVCTEQEIEADEFRKPSSMINSDDSGVLRAMKSGIGDHDKDSKALQAERLRAFTYRFITKKSFDVGFASAAETARTRCGDCTEHAVLLCAMLRADGIPARCVSGLVYADGIGKDGSGAMGYHMWTQAMLESDGKERWVDLDGALSEERPMDATHLAIRTLGLADGQTINDLMDILPTLGKLRITVEKVE